VSKLPLVTIVIPTWNRLPLVEEAVTSVIAQSYPHWELIVVDDGSTDGTGDRLRALGDSRIRVLSQPHRGHLGQLRNRAAAAGAGELIAFLDSDDIWLPQKLQMQVRALSESDAGWCYAGFEMMDATGRTIPMRTGEFRALSGWIVREVLAYKVAIAMPTLLVRRQLFEAVGGFSKDPRLTTREDHEMNLRLALKAAVVAVPDILVRVRDHPGRTTALTAYPYEQGALAYELFLAGKPDTDLASIARGICARELANASAQRLAAGDLIRAAVLFSRSLAHRVRSL
jgi:glycosyltransferase involved in cell wall biosynthesis